MKASVTRKRNPVFRWGSRRRKSFIMISVPPEVAPALNTRPSPRAIREPPATAARKGSAVTAPRGARRFVIREVTSVQ